MIVGLYDHYSPSEFLSQERTYALPRSTFERAEGTRKNTLVPYGGLGGGDRAPDLGFCFR